MAAVPALVLFVPRTISAQPCGLCSKPSFGAIGTYGTATAPRSVAVADFNGDGKADLAVANFYSNNVSVLLGNGDGTFLPAMNYGTGTYSLSVVVGDFNGDGKPDLAVANHGSNDVSILLGNGDGTFGLATSLAAGTNPYAIAVGDFNMDGKLDLAVSNTGSGDVSIFLGNGNGTFGAPTNYGAGNGSGGVVAGDLNGDGKLDLAVTNAGSSNISILLGNGDGTFGAPTNFAVPAAPVSLALGDFNGDAKLDLAVEYVLDNMFSILLGHGDGTFGAPANFAVPEGAVSGLVRDVNLDGKADLILVNPHGGTVSVLLGNGDGSFQPAASFDAGSGPEYVAFADFNGDGKPDLAVTHPNSDQVSILLNTNCQSRKIRVQGDVSSCNTPGTPFGAQPVVAVVDDGGNITCDTGNVAASIVPGTGTSGATLGGTTTVAAVGGIGQYTNLSIDLPGRAYRLRFTHSVGTTLSRTFTQGLSGPTITGPTTIAADVDTTYDAGAAYDTYSWLLDGSPIAMTESVTVSLAPGSHVLQASVTQDGCGPASSSVTITAVGSLACTTVSPGIQDGTFEAGPPWPAWPTQISTNFGTPLCTPGLCGTGGGTAGPYSGSSWAWFGGAPSGEVATLFQPVVLPAVPDLRLRFQMWIGYVSPPFSDLLYVTVDSNQVSAFQEPASPEGGYSQREVDLTPYADGRSHQVGFAYYQVGCCGPANFSVDDVQLVSCPIPAVSVNDLLVPQRTAGTVNATFTVSLSFPKDRTVTVDYQITPGTATPGVDYDPSGQPGSLHFAPGTTALPITVPVLGETGSSPPETFFVDLASAFFATIARSRGTATIVGGTDLAITKDDGRATATPRQVVTYTIVASNVGPNARAANDVTVTDTVPPALTGASWTCAGAGGGSCTASGQGNINDTVNLPVGATVHYTLTGTVSANPSNLRNTATVAVPPGMGDLDLTNNSATDADTLICAGETVVPADGRVSTSMIGAGATVWHGSALKIGDSYSVEFKNLTGTGTPPGAATVFAGDDGCTGNSTLTVRDTTPIDPGASPTSQRVSFIATGTETFFRMRLVNSSGAPVPYSVRVSDTALYSPAWSTNGSFDTFYSFQNTTGAILNGTLTMLDTTGVVLSTLPLSIPVGQTLSTNTLALGITRNQTGTARFTHDGPPAAVVAETAIANFTISPAYVQSVKFQAVREER